MADMSKLKRRSTLGAPPPPDEASTNLTAPEVAPAAPPKPTPAAPSESNSAPRLTEPQRKIERRRIDGRSLRRTGRTLQFATRITEEFDELLHKIAQRDGLKLVEVLENSVAAYESSRQKQDRD